MSADNVKFKMESNNIGVGISKVAQVVKSSEIVDDTGSAGHLDLDVQIPAGSLVIGSKVTVKRGFIGDSSCTLNVGHVGDSNNYARTAHNIFAAVRNLVQPGSEGDEASLGVVATDTTVRLIFGASSSMADIIADGTGLMLVEIFYFSTNVELKNGAPTEIRLNDNE
jgi:hypothetical protein